MVDVDRHLGQAHVRGEACERLQLVRNLSGHIARVAAAKSPRQGIATKDGEEQAMLHSRCSGLVLLSRVRQGKETDLAAALACVRGLVSK